MNATSISSRARRLAVSVALGGAVAGAALAVPAAATALAHSPAGTSTVSHTTAQQPVFVYYRCYVPGSGWMYCTDPAHS